MDTNKSLSEQDLIRKQLQEYVDTTPSSLRYIADQIGMCYPHVQRFLKYPAHRMGRVGMIRIKQFLAAKDK